MKKTLKICLIAVGFISMLICSACSFGGQWDGEITVTNCTVVPYWVYWITFPDSPGVDGIEIINENQYIIRVKTYDSFVKLLSVQCDCIKPCRHDNFDIHYNSVEKLLEKFTREFFETKNLIITELMGGVITMNFRFDSISKKGVINITETEKRTFGAIAALGIPVTIGITIDSSYITPASMSVSIKAVTKRG